MAACKKLTVSMIVTAVFLFMISGCTPMLRMGIRTAHPAFENMEKALFKQDNLQLAKEGLPGTIMLLEGMLETSPNDLLLLTMAAKAYTGMGMMVEEESPKQATALYKRGKECGIRALKQHRGFRKAMENGKNIGMAAKEIDDEKFIAPLLWTAASMGANVLLNVGDPMIAIDLGNVNTVAQQVIEVDSDYFYGFAHLFIGTANSMLPAAFGGDKEEALEAFETIFELTDDKFLLAKVFYARFYLTEDDQIQKTLREVVAAPDGQMPEIALINQIAKAKARYYLQEKGE